VAVNAEAIRSFGVSSARARRRILLDRIASRTVVLGGLIIIASILAILFVIASEVYPLFQRPAVTPLPAPAARAIALGPPAVGVDEYREIAYAVTPEGALQFVALRVAGSYPAVPIPGLDGATLASAVDLGKGRHLLGTSDGRVIPLTVTYAVEFKDGRRVLTPGQELGTPSPLDERKRPLRRLVGATPASGPITIAQVGASDLVMQSVVEKKALIGEPRREESVQALDAVVDGEITALALDGRGEDLFIGTARGDLVRYDVRDRERPTRGEIVPGAATGGGPISSLSFLIGDRTLVVGTGTGAVSTWQVVPPPTGESPRLTRVNAFAAHAAPITAVTASARDKGFVTLDAAGTAHLNYGTSGGTLATLPAAGAGARAVVFAPKADGFITFGARGEIAPFTVANPHPEITLRTLFGKVWYEGYASPAYVWQSTGGTDDFEAKFSLTPLLYGTLKGTFYALLIAVPLALLAALYVSEFMHPSVKAWVKPIVEIMAALPSVVLGFLAGLWLAPMVERVVPGLFVLPFVLTLAILVALALWRLVPIGVRGRVRPGMEVFLLVPVVLGAGALAFALGGLIEARLLAGAYRGWLLSALGLTYDQRNSLVVGVAMGFAVVPIIFTIAEDSLANVPQHLRAGSLAMGATRWQTAIRIVLPTASPGIFSATMIGFGRAIGETMIVLMATGNTPIMDGNIFSGFRALSANIAVELPEAPEGGTLFRVLFLAAFLLFCLTFVVNTVAEVVRLKLRQRYRYL
jgi:phosphate transport system permease protein